MVAAVGTGGTNEDVGQECSSLLAKDMIERSHCAAVLLICPTHIAAATCDDRPFADP